MEPERFELFKQLMNKEWLKQSIGGRATLAVLFTDEEFGLDGVTTRRSINIPSPNADLAFTYPLELYDLLTRTSMPDIINVADKALSVEDFYRNLTPLGRAKVYAHGLAILDFYTFPLDMIPGVNHNVLREGFGVLQGNIESVMNVFKPSTRIPSTLTYNLPPTSDVHSKDKMAWYLCASDLSWTRVLFEAVKSSTFELLSSPLHVVLCMAEVATQNFFNLYSSGVSALVKNEPLTTDQYTILNMVFKIDMDCYNDYVRYHKEINVLPDRFFDEMDIFCENVALTYSEVREYYDTPA